jgi:predicted ATPase/DNA-binding SARP family transcriptional activator
MVTPAVPPNVPVTYRQEYRRCGKATCGRCAGGGRGHGPYWYAYWTEGGRQRSRYLGKHAPPDGVISGDDAPGPAARPPREAGLVPLRVRTLGGFAVWRGDTPIPPEEWTSRRALALFTCLLSTPSYRLLREQAIEWLWPEADPAASATNLRTTLYLLRQVLDDPQSAASYLRTEGDLLVLVPGGATPPPDDWLDAAAFARASRVALAGQDAAACRAALALYGGDYLPDEPYAAWAEQLRASLRRQYLDLLVHLATLSGGQGEVEEAEACLRQVLDAEPGHEEAAAALMGLLAAAGRRSEALHVYQRLATVLEEDLDVAPSAEITTLRARILAQEAAPLAARVPPRQPEVARLTNLPQALTSFVGRVWEVQAVGDALSTVRLVTLTGPGGCGKTRLALEVAERQVEASPDGVWLVELAALADGALVPRAVAQVLGVEEQAGRPLRDALQDFLRPRHLMLVLDNCEHLIAACAELAAALLQSCPHLRVLATSRESLEVAGEHLYWVPSLGVPDPNHLPPLAQVGAYEAVQLFVQRAQARRPELALTPANVGAVVQICARLDGLPLAIELAAARVSALPIEGIAARLDDRFQLLTGGPRTALPRQQTMRATLDWSFELLSELEQVLLRRLAVFAGGCTLETAEAVCRDEDAMETSVLDLLSRLVHKSLVLVAAATDGSEEAEARYRLLETVRQYSLEKLEVAGEMAAVRDRHLAWHTALGEEAVVHLRGHAQLLWLDRLEREHDNLRAALQWSVADPRRSVAALRLAGAIWPLWALRGYAREGRRWLEQTLAAGAAAPADLRARAHHSAAELALLQGDYAQCQAEGALGLTAYGETGDRVGRARVLTAMGWAEQDGVRAVALGGQSLALAREAGAPLAIASALQLLGNVALGPSTLALGLAHLARAQAYLEEGLEIARGLGDRTLLADTLTDLGQVAVERGAYESAADLLTECLALQQELKFPYGIAVTLGRLGEVAYCLGDTARGIALLEESVVLCRALGYKDHLLYALDVWARIAWQQGDDARATVLLEEESSIAREIGDMGCLLSVLTGQGHVARRRGDHVRAVALHRESLALCRDVALPVGIAPGLEGLAMALAAQGQVAEAVWLLGTADAVRERLGRPHLPPDRAINDRFVVATRDALSADAFAAAWTAGRATPLDTALLRALEDVAGTGRA